MTFEKVVSAYERNESIREVARELNISHAKVRKVLITCGLLEYKETKDAIDELNSGKTVKEIAEKWGCAESTVHSYLPYTKGAYKGETPSATALRIRKYRDAHKKNNIEGQEASK